MSVNEPNWTDIVTAISAAAVPVLVVLLGIYLGRGQSRNEELVRVRLEYYKQLAPGLNRLMCYLTFIGTWRDDSPPDIIKLKRSLDSVFYSAAPLFSSDVESAYKAFAESAFSTFGPWGRDARINSSAFRRRQYWKGPPAWSDGWDAMFALRDEEKISRESLQDFQVLYDALLSALVVDTNVARGRPQYTTNRVALNASAGRLADIPGRAARRADSEL